MRHAMLLGCLALAVVQAACDVTLTKEGAMRCIQTDVYRATVEDDGCLTSLQVGGTEFLKSAPQIPRGAYMFQDGVMALTSIEEPGPNAIKASCDRGSVLYEFGPESMTWTLTNATDKHMVLVIVFDPALEAVQGPKGKLYKTPLELPWPDMTWYRGDARLRIEGGDRIWGPWAGNHQVWEIGLGAKQTRKVTLTMGKAAEDELQKVASAVPYAVQPPTDPTGPMWDMSRLSAPPEPTAAEGFSEPGVRAIFFDGPPFEGEPTRVFAWVGVPEVKPGEKVPGMVLVHGGGGTAFAEWVRLWTKRGYAAIALDTCGCVPRGTYGNWERHDKGGPPGWGGFGQIGWPREDQWTYHAVAGAILAHSLLRSLPEVDPDRTGLTGISWGGYLTCIIAGADPRFKLAVPVYGCGFTLDMSFAGSVLGLGKEGADRWMRWWDPSVYLPAAKMPMLWVTGSNDFAYTFNALQMSYRLPQGPRALCIRLRMPHGHGGAGENPEEIHAFADSNLMGGVPLVRITGQGRDDNEIWATFEGAAPVVKAELNITKDRGKWPERNWEAVPATVAGGRVTATLPQGASTYYLNLYDDRDLVVSTEHEELPAP